MKKIVTQDELKELTARIAPLLEGGEVIELVGDVGAGKTTFTKLLATQLGVKDEVQSPTFTISNRYTLPSGPILAHYDFYRLQDAGIMRDELAETVQDGETVTILEWSEIVADVLPVDHLKIELVPETETTRIVTISAGGAKSGRILEQLR